MRTPKNVAQLTYIGCCTSVSFPEWEKLMSNTRKANGEQIKRLIKEFYPQLYCSLALKYPNPYENRSVKKDGLLVYVHSGIEYFFTYQN